MIGLPALSVSLQPIMANSVPAPLLNAVALEGIFPPAMLERGREYFDRGMLMFLDVNPERDGLWQVEARMAGSGSRFYDQQLIFDQQKPRQPVQMGCSCPYSGSCKHLAAVLLALRSHSNPEAQAGPDSTEEWLAELTSLAPEENSAPPAFVAWVLDPTQTAEGVPTVTVSAWVTSRGEDGSWRRTRNASLTDVADARVEPDLDERDRQWAQTLLPHTAHERDVRNPVLDGAMLGRLLQELTDAGRCYWHSLDNEPLTVGDVRDLRLFWRETDEGYQLARAPEELELVLMEQPVYIDPDQGVLGPLQLPMPARTLAAFLRAPVVSHEEAARVTQRLHETFPDLDVPTPVRLERRDMARVRPTPVLLLTGDEFGNRARLRQRYGDFELPHDQQNRHSMLARGNTLWRIERDPDAEREAAHELTRLGLAPEWERPGDDPELYWRFPGLAASAHWYTFTRTEWPRLEEAGWLIQRDSDFHMDVVEADDIHLDLDEQGRDWFGVSLGIDIDGERFDLLPLITELLTRTREPEQLADEHEPVLLPLPDGRQLAIAPARLYPLINTLHELFDRADDEQAQISRAQALRLNELDDTGYVVRGAQGLRQQLSQLRDGKTARAVQAPPELNVELRDYQLEGLRWLSLLRETGCHGILADDMGLGKTLQTLAHLLREKQAGNLDRPALLIAPTSVISNWRREAERFTPSLKLLVLHGAYRAEYFDDIPDQDLVVTTYPLLARDRERLMQHDWYYAVLDEAQTIKNPRSKAARTARELTAEHRLCLTGTPMENHLGELWSQFHFLVPGLLGDERQFKRLFRTPIEKHGDTEVQQRLSRRVRPFLLRRTKEDVAAELPEKTDIERTLSLAPAQADLYETVRMAMDKRVRQALAQQGLARSQVTILDALLKLRQVCCDPRLLPAGSGYESNAPSVKLQYLRELLPDLVEEGRRILLFSQFTSMLELIATELDALGIPWVRLTGQTRKRDAVIERFRQGEAPIFLISLKAGGVGLNLAEADTVIHYDPWWNPAVETQATDRAHRIGQQKNVFVYKLVTEQTVEEKIIGLQQHKKALAEGIHSGENSSEPGFSEEDVRELLSPLE